MERLRCCTPCLRGDEMIQINMAEVLEGSLSLSMQVSTVSANQCGDECSTFHSLPASQRQPTVTCKPIQIRLAHSSNLRGVRSHETRQGREFTGQPKGQAQYSTYLWWPFRLPFLSSGIELAPTDSTSGDLYYSILINKNDIFKFRRSSNHETLSVLQPSSTRSKNANHRS